MFLCDGDVFALSADKLESVINKVRSYFPDCETFTMYAAVRNIKAKSDEDLARLAALGVNDLYIGHESGDNDALLFMDKGHTVADSIEQCARLDAAGITHHSLMVIGLSGAGTAERSGRLAADLVNKIKPGLASFFTLTLRDGSDLNGDVAEGRFNMPSAREMLLEQIVTLENITEPDVYFWASHMFNPYPVQGPVGTYKETMLAYLKKALGN
jgi:coproporphyrinogen III oxidase-like Fe-S oxidoreductase